MIGFLIYNILRNSYIYIDIVEIICNFSVWIIRGDYWELRYMRFIVSLRLV